MLLKLLPGWGGFTSNPNTQSTIALCGSHESHLVSFLPHVCSHQPEVLWKLVPLPKGCSWRNISSCAAELTMSPSSQLFHSSLFWGWVFVCFFWGKDNVRRSSFNKPWLKSFLERKSLFWSQRIQLSYVWATALVCLVAGSHRDYFSSHTCETLNHGLKNKLLFSSARYPKMLL